MYTLEQIKQTLRWNDWAQTKISLFCMTMFYLILKQSLYSVGTIKLFIMFLVFSVLISIYGYLINDLCDIDIDRRQGKKNVFEKIGRFW